MTPEQQRIAIAKAVGLKLVSESGLSLAELCRMDGYSHNSGRLQHIVDAWVSTDRRINPDGVWGRGGCSQAVEDKEVAEKWASGDPRGVDVVVAVKKCLDVPDYPNSLEAIHAAVRLKDLHDSGYFQEQLASVCKAGDAATEWHEYSGYRGQVIYASAAQHAEALIHHLNLWIED